MRKSFLILVVLTVSLTQVFAKEAEDNAAIVAATKSYVAANSGTIKITATVEKVEGDFARVKVSPQDSTATDPAWVFLRKKDGHWMGLTLGTGFGPEDYEQLGIPKSLRIQ